MPTDRRAFEFDGFRADLRNRLLSRGDRAIPLTPKAFDTLAVLLARTGEVLTKDQLLEQVWPDTFVEEATLTQNIYTLRKTLAEAGGAREYIETLPRRGYRFAGPVQALAVESPGTDGPTVSSLAVLPFEPLTGEAEDVYLGVGLADALITRLSNLRMLTVRPTSSVRRYVGPTRDPVAAGRELKVDAVLDGTLQRAGGRVRIGAQLIGVAEAAPLWAAKFDAVASEIFDLEDSISRRLAEELQLRLTPKEKVRLTQPTTRNPEAYQAYTRGRYFWNRRSEESLTKAISAFELAINLDPGFALAFSGLADSYVLLPLYGNVTPREAFPKAKITAERALELDNTLAEARTSLAYTRFFFDWDWMGAEEEFLRALALNPSYATAHHWYAFLLTALGRHDEAIARAERAVLLDPLSLVINTDLGMQYYFSGAYPRALDQFQRTLDLDPAFAYAHFGLGHAVQQLGDLPAAVREFRRAVELLPGSTAMQVALGQALAAAGQTAEARVVLADLEARAKNVAIEAIHFAFLFSALGDFDHAFDCLERACEERSRFVVYLHTWPIYAPLRDDPRWQNLAAKLGLPGR